MWIDLVWYVLSLYGIAQFMSKSIEMFNYSIKRMRFFDGFDSL